LKASFAAFTAVLRAAASVLLHAAESDVPRVWSAVTTVLRAVLIAVSRAETADAMQAPSTFIIFFPVPMRSVMANAGSANVDVTTAVTAYAESFFNIEKLGIEI
jgi:hypothetical protein